MPTDYKKEALQYHRVTQLGGEHTGIISVAEFSPDGQHIACGGWDGKITIWHTSTARVLHVLSGETPIQCLVWLKTDQLLAGLRNGILVCATAKQVRFNG